MRWQRGWGPASLDAPGSGLILGDTSHIGHGERAYGRSVLRGLLNTKRERRVKDSPFIGANSLLVLY